MAVLVLVTMMRAAMMLVLEVAVVTVAFAEYARSAGSESLRELWGWGDGESGGDGG